MWVINLDIVKVGSSAFQTPNTATVNHSTPSLQPLAWEHQGQGSGIHTIQQDGGVLDPISTLD